MKWWSSDVVPSSVYTHRNYTATQAAIYYLRNTGVPVITLSPCIIHPPDKYATISIHGFFSRSSTAITRITLCRTEVLFKSDINSAVNWRKVGLSPFLSVLSWISGSESYRAAIPYSLTSTTTHQAKVNHDHQTRIQRPLVRNYPQYRDNPNQTAAILNGLWQINHRETSREQFSREVHAF